MAKTKEYKPKQNIPAPIAELPTANPLATSANLKAAADLIDTVTAAYPAAVADLIDTAAAANPEAAADLIDTVTAANPEAAADLVDTVAAANPADRVDTVTADDPVVTAKRRRKIIGELKQMNKNVGFAPNKEKERRKKLMKELGEINFLFVQQPTVAAVNLNHPTVGVVNRKQPAVAAVNPGDGASLG